jgi:hypothetical protein
MTSVRRLASYSRLKGAGRLAPGDFPYVQSDLSSMVGQKREAAAAAAALADG